MAIRSLIRSARLASLLAQQPDVDQPVRRLPRPVVLLNVLLNALPNERVVSRRLVGEQAGVHTRR